MKCKYCEVTDLEWPENWVKGMKPIEIETHIPHTIERCNRMKQHDTQRDRGNFMWCGVENCSQCVSFLGNKYYKFKKMGDLLRA